MISFLILFLIFELVASAKVSLCNALNFSVTLEDFYYSNRDTVYGFAFNLAVALNSQSTTYPNNLTITNYTYWSLDESIYYQTSPVSFPIEYDEYEDKFRCPSINDKCVINFPNSATIPRINFYDNGIQDIRLMTSFFINNGIILGGTGKFLNDECQPFGNCILGDISCGTTCCTNFIYIDIPDYSDYQCHQFETKAIIMDANYNLNMSFYVKYDVTLSGINMSAASFFAPDGTYIFKVFFEVYDCRGNYSSPNSSCSILFINEGLHINENFQYEFILDFYSPSNTPKWLGALAGELIRRNGTFYKNDNVPFTPEDPCWTYKAGFPVMSGTYESSFCCTKFLPLASSSTLPPFESSPSPTLCERTTQSSTTIPHTLPNTTGTLCSNDTSQAWMDIVFVIDISEAMSTINIKIVSGEIATIMEQFNLAQNGDHSTRAGIIVYGTKVTIIDQLLNTTSFDDFEQAIFKIYTFANPTDTGANVHVALQQSLNILQKQKSSRFPVIVLFAAAYEKNGFQGGTQIANNIKDDGIRIIGINFSPSNGILANALQNISSPGYYYTSNQEDLYISISYALTQINCFCPPNTQQFRIYNSVWQNYTNYAECFYGLDGSTSPTIAQFMCSPGVLAALTNLEVFDFITNNIIPYDLKGAKKFTIGLHKSADSQWKWWDYNGTEYALGDFPMLEDTPNANDNYGYMWTHMGIGYLWVPFQVPYRQQAA